MRCFTEGGPVSDYGSPLGAKSLHPAGSANGVPVNGPIVESCSGGEEYNCNVDGGSKSSSTTSQFAIFDSDSYYSNVMATDLFQGCALGIYYDGCNNGGAQPHHSPYPPSHSSNRFCSVEETFCAPRCWWLSSSQQEGLGSSSQRGACGAHSIYSGSHDNGDLLRRNTPLSPIETAHTTRGSMSHNRMHNASTGATTPTSLCEARTAYSTTNTPPLAGKPVIVHMGTEADANVTVSIKQRIRAQTLRNANRSTACGRVLASFPQHSVDSKNPNQRFNSVNRNLTAALMSNTPFGDVLCSTKSFDSLVNSPTCEEFMEGQLSFGGGMAGYDKWECVAKSCPLSAGQFRRDGVMVGLPEVVVGRSGGCEGPLNEEKLLVVVVKGRYQYRRYCTSMMDLSVGMLVIVEGDRGPDAGTVYRVEGIVGVGEVFRPPNVGGVADAEEAQSQLRQPEENFDSSTTMEVGPVVSADKKAISNTRSNSQSTGGLCFPASLNRVIRVACLKDVERLEFLRTEEAKILPDVRHIVGSSTQHMVSVSDIVTEDVEFQYDHQKVTVYLRRPDRASFINFRRMQRRLHRFLKCRIWIAYMDEVEAEVEACLAGHTVVHKMAFRTRRASCQCSPFDSRSEAA
uniref:PSP1 C-terminal domain-containing protein n=1 Tax=Trypanosoma vivax (strain Y486) TaxID=1055687 RepID=G0U876_TRYVY|nr:conserved hypothetical protein [Trypanosoma vivax Y486]